MNRHLVKLAVTSARDDVKTIVNKFLSTDTFTSEDLRWWWDPSKSDIHNRIYVYRALNILKIEKCLTWILPLNLNRYTKYKKTDLFIEILNEILDIELLLNKCGVKTFDPSIEKDIIDRIIIEGDIEKCRNRKNYWNRIMLMVYDFELEG